MPRFLLILVLPLLLILNARAQAALPELNTSELNWLGDKIYNNECNRRSQCLTSWNQGEDFPSLGIGHFIWYRADQQQVFQETFPALLEFMSAAGVALPAWIEHNHREQPWPDRDSFLAAINTSELSELRTFLQNNMPLQTAFIVQRFSKGLEQILNAAPAGQQAPLRNRIQSIMDQAGIQGLYALIDYVHFKGEGTAPSERYADQGWGLLQVLQNMPVTTDNALQEFVHSANAVLARRVNNAPPDRNEQRWLNGWQHRLNTYLPENSGHTAK